MFNQGIRRVQEMLRDNNNKDADFDVSKLTVFVVNVFSTVNDAEGVPQDVPQDVPQGVTQNDTQGDTQNDTQGDTQGGTQGGTQDGTQDDTLDIWIESQIKKNPQITTEELAKLSNKGLRTIKRHIAKLSHIKYVGSGYSGHWEITDK